VTYQEKLLGILIKTISIAKTQRRAQHSKRSWNAFKATESVNVLHHSTREWLWMTFFAVERENKKSG